MTDQPLPQAPCIEATVLASLLSSDTLFSEYCSILRLDYFYDPLNKRVFQIMLELNTSDVQIIGERDPNIAAPLADIMANFAANVNIESEVAVLRDKYQRRKLIETASQAVSLAYNEHETTAKEIIETCIAGLADRFEYQTKPELVADIYPRLIQQITSRKDGTGIKTGLSDIDKTMGCLLPGEIVIVAGRPSMGKTSFALQIARNNRTTPTLIFSIETSKEIMTARIAFANAGVAVESGLKGIGIAEVQSGDFPIYIDDQAAIPLIQLERKAEYYTNKLGIGLIIIDHIGLIKYHKDKQSRHLELSEISKGIKALAKKLNVPIIPISQLSRAVEARKPPIPMLSDLRESGSLEEDADKVLFLYRDEYYNRQSEKKGIAEVIVAKNKNGGIGYTEVQFNLSMMSFNDLSKDQDTDWRNL